MAPTTPFKDWLEKQQAPGREVRQAQQYLGHRAGGGGQALGAWASSLTSSPGQVLLQLSELMDDEAFCKLWGHSASSSSMATGFRQEKRGHKLP